MQRQVESLHVEAVVQRVLYNGIVENLPRAGRVLLHVEQETRVLDRERGCDRFALLSCDVALV